MHTGVGLQSYVILVSCILRTWWWTCRWRTQRISYKNTVKEAKIFRYYDYLMKFLLLQIWNKIWFLGSVDHKRGIPIFILMLIVKSFHLLNVFAMHLVNLLLTWLFILRIYFLALYSFPDQCMHLYSWWEQNTISTPVYCCWHLYFIQQKPKL